MKKVLKDHLSKVFKAFSRLAGEGLVVEASDALFAELVSGQGLGSILSLSGGRFCYCHGKRFVKFNGWLCLINTIASLDAPFSGLNA